MRRVIGFDTSALDPSFKAHAARGIGRYVRELKNYFHVTAGQDPEIEEFDHRTLLAGSVASNFIDKLPAGRATLKQQLLYPTRLSGKELAACPLLHFPAHTDAPAWSRKPYILTILDLIPLILKELYAADQPNLRFRFARFLELRAMKQARMIIAISECTARDVERILKIPRSRIVVTPLGVDNSFVDAFAAPDQRRLRSRKLAEKLSLPAETKFLLYVGGIDKRKNIPLLVRVMREVVDECKRGGVAPPTLVLAGKIEGEREFPKLVRLIDDLQLAQWVVRPGFVPDAELIEWYQGAHAFLFPSLYEGFGLPVLEAMAAGLPVLASNTSSIPEVVGDTGTLLPPDRHGAWVRAILDLLSNDSIVEQGVAAHRRARMFTWEKTGELTRATYREALSRLEGGVSYADGITAPR